MTPLTVACVWVQGNVPFTAEYVTRLEGMCRRWIARDFRFVCLTDRPDAVLCESIRVKSPKQMCGWWSKVELFAPNLFTGRVLYLDLDTLIVAPLDPVIDFPAPFALAPHAGTFEGKNGLTVVKRFNSSVMVWDAGITTHLYEDWNPLVAMRLWGDQDWIGEQRPGAATMPALWFPRISELGDAGPSLSAKVVLCKKPKNLEAVKRYPWVRRAWGAAA